jgi:fructan beta-fructosidase
MAADAPSHASRTLTLRHRYLLLPVRTGAAKRRARLAIEGRTVREFEIELAEGKPDFHAFLELSSFAGRTAALTVDGLPPGSPALDAVEQSDRLPDEPLAYREARRPQFHFTSRVGWLNDPNGLVYSDGEWHLYYQHNPYGWDWGNMHWGHAVSKDLVHWRELPIALYPREFGDWAFSGSAVVDRENTSGFAAGKGDLLVAAYTSTGRGECILHSSDRGRTWTEYAGNPVIRHAGRDPRLVWHAPTRRWVMAVYDEHEGGRWIAFYSSPDLKAWSFESRIEGFYECPELFEIAVEGRPDDRRWILYGADGRYLVGRFDGRAFHAEGEKQQLWYGHFYASQTYSDAPQGRRVQIGWGNGIAFPGAQWNQQMTFPVELRLRDTGAGLRLFGEPVRELSRLHGRRHPLPAGDLRGERPLEAIPADTLAVRATFELGTADSFGFVVRGVPVIYDDQKREIRVGSVTAPLEPQAGRVTLDLLVDRGSIEVFGNHGRVALSAGVAFPEERHDLALFAHGGSCRLVSGQAIELKSAWR